MVTAATPAIVAATVRVVVLEAAGRGAGAEVMVMVGEGTAGAEVMVMVARGTAGAKVMVVVAMVEAVVEVKRPAAWKETGAAEEGRHEAAAKARTAAD